MALQALVYGLDTSDVSDNDGRALFVNAQYHERFSSQVDCVQWFKPYATHLSDHEVFQRIEDVDQSYDVIYLLVPKNMIEARYLIARSLQILEQGGDLFCACENQSGGKRLQKIMQQFNAEIVQQISKYKSRFVQVKNNDVDITFVENSILEGCVQSIDKINFISQPGVYGWNKIDVGSAILAQHVPQDLKGNIADFGCGYGFLLQHILQQNDRVKTAYAIDADARALHVADQNLDDKRADYLWMDLRQASNIPAKLDAIIMNPPFHEGKKTDSGIGADFIRVAAKSLKRNGALYMVANNQLPYEAVLNDVFFNVEVLAQQNGFKVFKAVV
ncbi:MAG: methyltransferase [Bdellovibrionales bacterium]